MADKKEVNKVVYGDDTLIDLTEDTVSEDTLAKGATAHNAQGLAIEGTFEDAIQHIKVNGEEQPIEDNTVDITAVQSVKVGTIDTGAANVVNSGTDADVVFDFTFPDGAELQASYDEPTETLIFSSGVSVDDETLIISGSPSGGGGEDQRIVTGTIANNDYAVIPCTFCQLTYGGANTTYSGMAVYSAGRVKSISSASGFDVDASSNGISIDNYCGAMAYYIAIIIE